MKNFLVLSLFLASALVYSQEKEGVKGPAGHGFLKQFIGTWNCDVEMILEPGKPPEKEKSIMVCTPIGNYWMALDIKGNAGGMPFHGVGTFGYDEKKKEFFGTWVDNMAPFLWKFSGASAGNSLTLFSEGPNPMKPDELMKTRDVYEFKTNAHLILTSSYQGADNKWVQMMKADCKKK